jgi:hypothetical protein
MISTCVLDIILSSVFRIDRDPGGAFCTYDYFHMFMMGRKGFKFRFFVFFFSLLMPVPRIGLWSMDEGGGK